MNTNRNLVIDFRVNNEHDHFIGDVKHTQPHQKKKYATKPKKITHKRVEEEPEEKVEKRTED